MNIIQLVFAVEYGRLDKSDTKDKSQKSTIFIHNTWLGDKAIRFSLHCFNVFDKLLPHLTIFDLYKNVLVIGEMVQGS